jgi:hypothetical protein
MGLSTGGDWCGRVKSGPALIVVQCSQCPISESSSPAHPFVFWTTKAARTRKQTGQDPPLAPIPHGEPDAMVTPRQSFSRSAKPMRNGRVSGHPRPRQNSTSDPIRGVLLTNHFLNRMP